MKNTYFLLTALFVSFSLQAQIIDIPDPYFKTALRAAGVDTNNDGEIQITEAEAITSLNFVLIARNSITSVEGIEYFVNLEEFVIFDNELTEIDVSALTNLIHLDCSYNNITSLTLNNNLEYLNCRGNDLTSINLNNLNNLQSLSCTLNNLNSIDVSSLTNLNLLHCSNNQLSLLDINSLTNLVQLECNNNQLMTLDVTSSPNLYSLKCRNNQLTSLDVNGLDNLTILESSNNNLTTLNTSSLIALEKLSISNNQLSQLDVSQNNSLKRLFCSYNEISTLDLSSNLILEDLDCSNNMLSELDISLNQGLTILICSNNQLSELEIMHPSLGSLYCSFNFLTELDVSNSQIESIDCSNNQLVYLNVKNGSLNSTVACCDPCCPSIFAIDNNPDLSYVCADNEVLYYDWYYDEITIIQNIITQNGYTDCHVNNYCSFVPGGDFYTIEGNVKFDSNTNGCDVDDDAFTNLNFTISNGSESGNFIANSSGNYAIPVQEGNHTITPTIENPDYFTVSPSSITVSFPTGSSPYMQDFCVTPNGTHHDLEITLLPTQAARPGFDATYKLNYKNKGTTTLSGTINLNFMDAIMDFVSASPSENSQSADVLGWNFNDLTPFESREITLTMNINAPTDTPPVNDGDILEFTATIDTSETDETPDDNISTLNQTVVNSLDPNDKTCLEGNVITPEMVGKYVHYMIRFENTGSADAINIVVKDDIDITKYDLSTLIPIDASHDFVAKVKDEGSSHYVEFIFENVNLPFDDANNDGYIAFKIKTLNSLQLGDTFENDAEIYFDYNFPIITNNEQTTVATLSVTEFELAQNSISLYPNPTTNLLHIDAQQNIQQVNIYDVSGRLIKNIAIIGEKTSLEISTESLTSGTYFVKIESENSTLVKKVIKD